MKDSKVVKSGEANNSQDNKNMFAIELKQTSGQDFNNGSGGGQGDLTTLLPWDISGFVDGP